VFKARRLGIVHTGNWARSTVAWPVQPEIVVVDVRKVGRRYGRVMVCVDVRKVGRRYGRVMVCVGVRMVGE
jgi:hypothetical protein